MYQYQDILDFVSQVNQEHYDLGGGDIPPLSYWDNGVVCGIDLFGFHLWDSEEDAFDPMFISAMTDEIRKELEKLLKTASLDKDKILQKEMSCQE